MPRDVLSPASPSDRDIELLAAELDLERQVQPLLAPGSPKLERALLELDSRSIILFGRTLDIFLRGYLRRFPLDNLPLSDGELDDLLEVAFDEGTQPLTRHLLKLSIDNAGPVSLAELARRRWPDAKSNLDDLRKRLKDEVLFQMRDLKLWDVQIEERTVKGRSEIAKFKISAGSALLHFYKFVFVPFRTRQLRQLLNAFPQELQS